jgi:hypothetical protein
MPVHRVGLAGAALAAGCALFGAVPGSPPASAATSVHQGGVGSGHPSEGPVFRTGTLAAMAEVLAKGAHDPTPVWAAYVTTTRARVNRPDRVDAGSMPVVVVAMRGHFRNPVWASEPAGAPILRGNTVLMVVDARTGRTLDVGLTNETAAELASWMRSLDRGRPPHPLDVRRAAR